jgi:hypothetical protein
MAVLLVQKVAELQSKQKKSIGQYANKTQAVKRDIYFRYGEYLNSLCLHL